MIGLAGVQLTLGDLDGSNEGRTTPAPSRGRRLAFSASEGNMHSMGGSSAGSLNDYTLAYLIGISRAADYHAIAVRRETDEVDPRNGTKFWTACWNVNHADLADPSAALTAWGGVKP